MMARATELVRRAISYINTHKIKSILWGLGALSVIFYSLAFFIPKNVQFSYAGDTCVGQLTLLPNVHKAQDESKLKVTFKDEIKIGSLGLASTKTCFTAASEPKSEKINMATSPFGTFIARKHFSVEIPDAPTANMMSLDKPLPVSKPLEVTLSEPDSVFSYYLENGTSYAGCSKSTLGVACDVPALKLQQGKEYSLKLTRSFRGNFKTTLLEKPIRTLEAVEIRKSSLKDGQTVYSKPSTFTFTTDKSLTSSVATLSSGDKKPQQIPIKTSVKDKTLTVSLPQQLERETKYRLTLKSIEASDGSTLVEPKKIDFSMSGGPKVTGVSIGSSKVNSSAVATIQFDQKLGSSDVTKYVKMVGGRATISKSDSSVSVALQSLPRCKAFSLTVASGLQSNYGIKSKNGWKFNSRTLCHTVSTYGSSVQGRPLQAYIFGNSGPVTMYVGAIHGNESSSSGLMQAWINNLEANPSRMSGKRIVVVPTINPDGVAAGTRTNSRGVNLNRNFPTDNWQRDIDDTDGTHKNGGGKKPLSEPEAKALAGLTQSHRPRLLLSFHAVGSLVQGDSGSPSASYAAKYASLVGYRNATGQGDTFDYGITGGYEDWAWRNAGVPSMVVELGSYGYFDFEHHKNALSAML